ncbi:MULTISPECIES: acyl-homoserine-lactone synthase [Paraburkholderia]|uniref:acyl-homoserine-lactone synthase n=1 Tax=Paraburkholderia TaxID=1822464 RepID=UPI002250C93B|nr:MULTISPECIES: acyl-homoserine-lactone synthase [Paraburkholderia]MCX4166320.1 GNAT family N-acetyltransferase [Paraburkholderia megapolitana]MDN7161810.1 GNAT family N-acetyltransferase [Paraburkholderia sp. CHISQ3]MDQ6498858.1 GNAT family N-acetyltransferase [Paraburkholderia megapolitana]
MITTITRSGKNLANLRRAVGQYRYKIFIEQLGWQLPTINGLEQDQFDLDETLYVIGVDEHANIHGCARLLPTSRPYLLSEVFPFLMDSVSPPSSNRIWELSRFAVSPAGTFNRAIIDVEETTRIMLTAAVACAAEHGAERLITVSPLGIERLLSRMGVHAHRAGQPQRVDGKLVFACWIEIDAQTKNALTKFDIHECLAVA